MLEEIGKGNRSMKSYYTNGNHVEAIALSLDVELKPDVKKEFNMSRHLQLKYAKTVNDQATNFIRGTVDSGNSKPQNSKLLTKFGLQVENLVFAIFYVLTR